jgi:uncharacterized protein
VGGTILYKDRRNSQRKMPTNRELDENGYLLVRGCPISSYGIFDYGAGQLDMPGDPNRIVKVFRPESAVNDPNAIASFKNVPLINDHEMLSGFSNDSTATAPEKYGVSGVLTANVYYDSPWMRGDIKVFSREMQEALQSGKKDLSLGYSCDFIEQPGIWNNQPYEAVQTNLRGNHIALVEEGRVPGARVLDGLCFDHMNIVFHPLKKGVKMQPKGLRARTVDKSVMDNAVEQLKALLPALEQFLNEEATEPNHSGAGAVPPAEGNEESGESDAGAVASVAEPDAAPPAAAPAGAPADPAAAEPGGDDIQGIISQIEGILAKLKAALGANAASPPMSGDEAGVDAAVDEAPAAPGSDPIVDEEEVADTVTGLAGTNTGEGAAVCADEGGGAGVAPDNGGKASPGPSAGEHSMAGDAVFQKFYADMAAKATLYDRLSRVVGTFDCKAMDSKQLSTYGVKKLGIKCAKGQEAVALDAYLNATSKAELDAQAAAKVRVADAAVASGELDAYLKGA